MNSSSSTARFVAMAISTSWAIDAGQARHVRPEQALPLVDLAGLEVDDRLEDHAVVEVEEQVEHLPVGDLDRLAHADALGDPRLLDGRGEGHEVAV